MAETTLEPRSPFGEPLDRRWRGVRLVERHGGALAHVAARRGMAGEVRSRLSALGLAVPDAPRRVAGEAVGTSLELLWCGHEQWLASGDAPDLASRLEEALAGAASVTEQSGAWVNLRLEGPRARDVLERLCPVDLDPGAFPPGAVARTAMEHLQAVVALVEDRPDPAFVLLAASSSARSFRDALAHAATSACGEPVSPGAAGDG